MRRVLFAPKGATAIACFIALLSGVSASAQEPVYQPVNTDGLAPLELFGFGDPGNTRMAAMKWFKGDLYVATERWTHCVFAAVVAQRYHLPVYPPTSDCAPDPSDLTLAAEIWRFSPSDGSWENVFTSPETVPAGFDPVLGTPTKFIGRDIAFSAMEVFTESDGTEALYVGGRTFSGRLGSPSPLPPRLLRSVDGVAWTEVPAAPGTFLGELGRPLPGSALVATGFDQLVALDGTLVGVLTTGFGDGVEGMLIASSNPAAGNDAWSAASPPPEELPISSAIAFGGRLYVGVDARARGTSYSVYRTDGTTSLPFFFVPVLETDPSLEPRADRGWRVDFAEHGGSLYATAGWPLEVVRIDADDSWKLVVGTRRSSADGLVVAPTSGIAAGFGNIFNAQGVAMGSDGANLYLGTLDTTLLALLFPNLAPLLQHELGFDLFRTEEGIYWYPVSKVGLGVPSQYGASTMTATPLGLALGTLGVGGAEVWTTGGVAPSGLSGAGGPYRVEAAADALTDEAILSWEPDPDAVLYHVYRSEVTPILEALGGGRAAELIDNLDADGLLCSASPPLCEALRFLREDVGLPGPYAWIGATTDLYYVEPPPTSLQSMYFVRTERSDGSISEPSNVVGAVSTAIPMTFPVVAGELETRLQNDELGLEAIRALTMVRRAAHSVAGGNVSAAVRMLEQGESILESQRGLSVTETLADDLCLMIYRLRRNLQLAEWLLIDPSLLM